MQKYCSMTASFLDASENSHSVGSDVQLSKKRKRIRSRKACERCHIKKVRCDFKSPCSTCASVGLSNTCEYMKFEKPVYVTVRKDYIEDLIREIELLKKKLTIISAQILTQPGLPDRKMVETSTAYEKEGYNPMSLSSILDDNMKADPDGNPLVSDQNIPNPRAHFAYVGDSACSKFNTKLQQYVLYHLKEDHPQSGFINDQRPLKFEDDELHWNNIDQVNGYSLPDKIEAQTLIGIALKYIGVEYYFTMNYSFGVLVEEIYENYKPGKIIMSTPNKKISRSQMAQFFAICALGSLYCGKIANADRKVPGTDFFKTAVALLRDDFEDPTIWYVEALSQISYYSYALNRVGSAYVYIGLALRVGLSLGLHRRSSFWNNISLDLKERERGRRLFYTLLIFDRQICAKLGYPVSISDDDIDTELPSEMYFTELEYREFPDSKYMLAQIQIASISSLITTNIYGINQLKNKENKKKFVYNVHVVLHRLKECYNNLDPSLKLQSYNNQSLENVLRNIFSFHMHYNQLIILTTRPLLLYIFTRAISNDKFVPSQVTLAIGEACVQSAYAINSLTSTLYRTGKISNFGYFDSHYCFSSTVILIISTMITTFDARSTSKIEERIKSATDILKNLAKLGNIPARHFSEELTNLQATFKEIDVSQVTKVFNRVVSDDDDLHYESPFVKSGLVAQGNKTEFFSLLEGKSQQTDNILQDLGACALNDEILTDFLNSNFDRSLEHDNVGLEDLFKFDEFEQLNDIFRDFQR